MASFDENGKYIKTNWKAGDKITATKLNKIEESIEAVNDNDISRHVEADARLDALEAKDVAHDKELTKIKNTIEDNKAAAELGDYDINSRMTFLENELNEGIEEVHNVASTAQANMTAQVNTATANMTAQVNTAKDEMTTQVNQGKADMEAMVAEVEADLEGLHAKDEELSEQLEQIVDYVTYEQFGAVGDGVTDDYESIFKTHEFANINNKKVITNNNKTYLIKNVPKPIIIKNDVDWGKSKFIIDDSEITLNESYINVFLIDSDSEEFEISIESLNKSTRYIPLLSNETGFVYVENSNKKQYIRKGVNANDGENQQEVFFVDKGQLLNDIIWDYSSITKATFRNYDSKAITVNGGFFHTIANNLPVEWPGVNRNILCKRDNVTISNLTHTIDYSNCATSKPYKGFVRIENCYSVVLDGLQLEAHKTYYKNDIPYGNYGFTVFHSINIVIKNIKQLNSIVDDYIWCICETNYCKNLKFDNCHINRVDVHKSCLNIDILNVMTRVINLIGFGRAYIKNTTCIGTAFVNLREDFGCSWDGDLIIEDCEFSPPTSVRGDVLLIHGKNNGDHDFGYKCYFPNVYLKNVKVNNHNASDDFSFIYNKTIGSTPISTDSYLSYDEEVAKGLYPYIYKDKYVIDNVKFLNPCNAHIFYDLPAHCYNETQNRVISHDTSTNLVTVFCTISPNFTVELSDTILNSRYSLVKYNSHKEYEYNNYRLVPKIKLKNTDISLHLYDVPMIVEVNDSNVQEIYIGLSPTSGVCYINNSTLGYCNKYTINKITTCSNRSLYLNSCLLSLSGKESETVTADIIKTSYDIFNHIGEYNDQFRLNVKMNDCRFTFDTKLLISDDDMDKYAIEKDILYKNINFKLYDAK